MQVALSQTSRSGSSFIFDRTALVKSVSAELIRRVSEIRPRWTVYVSRSIVSWILTCVFRQFGKKITSNFVISAIDSPSTRASIAYLTWSPSPVNCSFVVRVPSIEIVQGCVVPPDTGDIEM